MARDQRDGYDRLEERADQWGNNLAGKFADRPIWTSFKLFLSLAVILVVLNLVLSAIFGVGAFFGAWGKEAKRVVSPENVTLQYEQIINDWESLVAGADNACQAGSPTAEAGDPTMVESVATAYSATYRRIVVDYNRRQANIFEANKVGPPGYPKEIPRFPEATGKNPDWCAVADKLEALRE